MIKDLFKGIHHVSLLILFILIGSFYSIRERIKDEYFKKGGKDVDEKGV